LVEELCKHLSIPYYVAHQEAESFSTYLCKTNQVELVITEDSDVLAYGCPVWISNVGTNGNCTEVRIDDVLRQMEFTMEQFIDFCILCGTDFNETIKGVGSVSAYKAIKEFQTIEAFLASKNHASLQEQTVRNIFNNPCCNAVVQRGEAEIKTVEIQFNPLPKISSLRRLSDLYPIQSFIQWIQSYPTWFVEEE